MLIIHDIYYAFILFNTLKTNIFSVNDTFLNFIISKVKSMSKSMAFKHFVVKMHFFQFQLLFFIFNLEIIFNFEKEEWCILMMEWMEQGIWRHRQDNAWLRSNGQLNNS